MHHQVLFITNSTPKSISISSFLFINLLFSLLQLSYTQSNEGLLQCFEAFKCGNITDLVFPFWNGDRPPLCHQPGFELTGCEVDDQHPNINIDGNDFLLIFVNRTTYTMTIARKDLSDDICPSSHTNITLGSPLLHFSPTNQNLTFFYDCELPSSSSPPPLPPSPAQFQCGQGSSSSPSFYVDDSERAVYEDFQRSCGGGDRIQVQVNRSLYEQLQSELRGNLIGPRERWNMGFDVVYDLPKIFCDRCNTQDSLCDELSTPDYPICKRSAGSSFNLKTKLIVGSVAGTVGVLITCIAFFCWRQHRRGKGFFKSYFVNGKSSSNLSLVIDSERGDSFSGVHLFTYKELEEATNNFDSSKELGDGGFGTVYYGKLRDGRTVAVKRLYENNFKRVEQFMNEVEILTRLRHQYLVSLYGCTSRHSRELLLVYEYVANGTIADHLHGERAKPGALPWHIRLDIAIETANALRYLHASDTIHRDVKTNNILLDNDFHVKVADFGLSRLFPTDVTHVSTAPQGTPGYVDPEYHQCYQLTSKSDVFSFGVVLIELISSKPAVDITRHRHEINLWNMAINKIQNRALHELVDPSLGFETKEEVRKTITGVAELAFQCLQNEKDMRPTMEQVLDALMGIQNEDYKKEKAEEMDMFRAEEEGGLLKSGPLPHSPDSVMIKWLSNGSSSTTTTPSF